MRVTDGFTHRETLSLNSGCIFFWLILCTASVARTLDTGQEEAIQRLSRVFRIDRVPMRNFNRSPPQYMTELFENITDRGGLMRMGSPYDANTVRSFPDKVWNQQLHFKYNLSYLQEEKILAAEFRLFRLRPKPSWNPVQLSSHIVEIRVYQVLDTSLMHTNEGLRLLASSKTSAHTHGWLVFDVTKAVWDWANGTNENHGFLVTSTMLNGREANGSYVRFAQRMEHHDSKQPILVVYTDDGMPRHPSYISPDDADYRQIRKDIIRQERLSRLKNKDFKKAIRFLNEKDRDELESQVKQTISYSSETNRQKRSITSENSEFSLKRMRRSRKTRNKKQKKGKRALGHFQYRRRRKPCSRHEMYVDFDEIGWSGWIISPKGYNAYHCKGECPFPLGQSLKPTNHATVQSIVHALGVGRDVNTPCCVPNKLYSISLLYFDDDENVILKQYDDMVASSCGCH